MDEKAAPGHVGGAADDDVAAIALDADRVALLEADLTRAAALLARRRLGARLRAAPVAGGARREPGDRDRLLDAACRLLEGDLELVLEVLAATRPRAAAPPATRAEEVAEEVADDVLEAATEVEAAEPALFEGG